jgi:hypothetical protein
MKHSLFAFAAAAACVRPVPRSRATLAAGVSLALLAGSAALRAEEKTLQETFVRPGAAAAPGATAPRS